MSSPEPLFMPSFQCFLSMGNDFPEFLGDFLGLFSNLFLTNFQDPPVLDGIGSQGPPGRPGDQKIGSSKSDDFHVLPFLLI
jgi:hypothetical protein